MTQRSSLRLRAPGETLALVGPLAATFGITRVVDTTPLDRLGVPVFASIRPGATTGSLCVSAGKGLTAAEAEVGAIMEGIELALAEPGRARLPRVVAAARELCAPFADFIPQIAIGPDTPLPCVQAHDLRDGAPALVPLERVLFPVLPADGGGIFGSDTNGLASGNSVEEATLHALAELLERDVASFLRRVDEDTRPVTPSTLPAPLRELVAHADGLGLDLVVRTAANEHGLPYFLAGLHDRADPDRAHRGDALHPHAAIAATRAVCEAFQSRLTDIHGGRDDLTFHRAREHPLDRTADAYRRFIAALPRGAPIDWQEIPDVAPQAPDIASATALLLDGLAARGFERVLRVVLSPPDLPVAVVRVLVPGLECMFGLVQRAGRRLREAHARRT